MDTLPLPLVEEIGFDELVALLPAECRINLTACGGQHPKPLGDEESESPRPPCTGYFVA